MRIGIDMDGVLTDLERWRLDYASKFYYETYNKEIENFRGYETDEIFNVNREYDNAFWTKYFKEYAINTKARSFASEVIQKLKEEGNEIFIITARGNPLSYASTIITREENRKIVTEWLNKNKIYYDKLILSPEEKLDICLENRIDVMIEDSLKNINHISTKIPVICFHADYNETCNTENVIRCYSWYDIYAKLRKFY